MSNLWEQAKRLGAWAWHERKSYLPRETWRRLREVVPEQTLDPAALVAPTRTAAQTAPWRELWGGAPRQRLLRKMFELAAQPSLSVRDVAHLAFNAGQVEASGAIAKLRRLAASDPKLANLGDLADLYDRLGMGRAEAYVTATTALPSVSDATIAGIERDMRQRPFPPLPADRRGAGAPPAALAVLILAIIVLAFYFGAQALGYAVSKNALLASVLVSAAVVGGGFVVWSRM
jgi:hypothetical protein